MSEGRQYDAIADPQFTWGRGVIARLPTHGVHSVLDAGCGSGRVTESLLRAHPDATVVGVDSSSSMLATASHRLAAFGDRVRLIEASLDDDLTLAIADGGPFDAVFSTGAFHWIRDHEQPYRRIFCLLLPGGWLVDGLDELAVHFVRMNLIARRPEPGLTGPDRLRG